MKAYIFQTSAKALRLCLVSGRVILPVLSDVKMTQSTLAESPLDGKKSVWKKGVYMINDERLRQSNLHSKGGI